MPGVSIEGDKGSMSSVGHRETVSFKPAVPVSAAGRRTEPLVSLATATRAVSCHSDTGAPLDDPPAAQ